MRSNLVQIAAWLFPTIWAHVMKKSLEQTTRRLPGQAVRAWLEWHQLGLAKFGSWVWRPTLKSFLIDFIRGRLNLSRKVSQHLTIMSIHLISNNSSFSFRNIRWSFYNCFHPTSYFVCDGSHMRIACKFSAKCPLYFEVIGWVRMRHVYGVSNLPTITPCLSKRHYHLRIWLGIW